MGAGLSVSGAQYSAGESRSASCRRRGNRLGLRYRCSDDQSAPRSEQCRGRLVHVRTELRPTVRSVVRRADLEDVARVARRRVGLDLGRVAPLPRPEDRIERLVQARRKQQLLAFKPGIISRHRRADTEWSVAAEPRVIALGLWAVRLVRPVITLPLMRYFGHHSKEHSEPSGRRSPVTCNSPVAAATHARRCVLSPRSRWPARRPRAMLIRR